MKTRALLRSWGPAVAAALVLSAAVATAAGHTSAGHGDVDGDGFADLAIGAPSESVASLGDAGMVTLVFGAESGPGRSIVLTQGRLGERTEAGDRFGAAVALGDFDSDGFADVAIGSPGEDLAGSVDAGVVQVVAGSPNGLDPGRAIVLSSDDLGAEVGSGDFLGAALAVGDFDGDGRDDLAVGAPGTGREGIAEGAVHILFGAAAGLDPDRAMSLPEQADETAGPEALDSFGAAIAAGDFDADGFDDLVVAAPGDDVGQAPDIGSVTVMFGSPEGPLAPGVVLPLSAGLEAGAQLGTALAVGDFDGDGFDDLAIGAPGSDSPGSVDSGAVVVVAGSPEGLADVAGTFIQGAGLPGTAEPADRAGSSLAAGDFDADGFDDLAVGIPSEDLGALADCGVVAVLAGGPDGLGSGLLIHQGSVGGAAGEGDRFGFAMRSGDFDGDGVRDLAIAAPAEDLGAAVDAGLVHVVHGEPGVGLVPAFELLVQGRDGLAGLSESGDRFGSGL